VLIVVVSDDDAPHFYGKAAYGMSQRTSTLSRGEFAILRQRNAVACETAGLTHDSKFDLGRLLDLPYSSEWFAVPPAAPHGQTPKFGMLHLSLLRAVGTAYRAVG
jgi:hypothetical protein